MTESVKTLFKIILSILIASSCLIADIFTEYNVSIGIAYIFLVISSILFNDLRAIVVMVVVSTVLLLIGWKFSFIGSDSIELSINRTLSLIAIWTVGIILFINLRVKNREENKYEIVEGLLFEKEKQLDTMNSAVIVSIADKNGDITFANDRFCEISKYHNEELIGQNHRILKSGVHPEGLFKGIWFSISSGRVWSGEICNKAKDGSMYWVATTIAPFFNSDNEIERYVSFRFDITKQKELDIKLKAQREDLIQENEKLNKANRDLEALRHCVYHDLKAPLQALQGFSKVLLSEYSDKVDDQGKRWLEFIKSNAERMDVLISDILTFSKISKSKITYSKMIMKDTVQEVFEQERRKCSNTINLNMEGLPDTYGDLVLIKFVWQSLIANAIKYSSRKDNIEIDISGREDQDFHHYKISDNGAGFDMFHYDKLFGVFQRLHSNKEFNGSGIGLANAKQIVEKHGGEIKAHSEIGKGSTFEFTIKKNRIEQV